MDPLIITSLFQIGKEILKRKFPDLDMQQQTDLELEKLEKSGDLQRDLGQISINIEEAKNESLFVSGWRPYIGWVCGNAFAYHMLLLPILLFIGNIFNADIKAPKFDMSVLMTVLMGMLGLGGLRTFEKYHGVNVTTVNTEQEIIELVIKTLAAHIPNLTKLDFNYGDINKIKEIIRGKPS